MIKKAGVIILTICIMLSCIFIVAEGSASMTVSYNAEKASVTLSGTANGNAGVIITDFFVSPENITTEDILYSNQFFAAGDYSYEVELPTGFESGKYSVIFTAEDGEVAGSFSHMNIPSAFGVLETLSDADSEDEFVSLIESGDNAKTLGIDKEDEYYAKNKGYAYKLLYKLNENYTEPVKFNETFYKFYAISIMFGGSDTEVIDAANTYADKLLINFKNEFQNDERLSTKAFEYLLKLLSKINYLEEFENRENTDFAVLLEESKYAAAVNEATNWQAVKKAVTQDFNSFFDVNDNNKFKKISNKNDVYAEMMIYTYSSYADVKKGFDDAVEKVYNSENNKLSFKGGSMGGSTGGSAGGGNMQIPADIEETFPADNKLTFKDFPEEHWSYDAVLSLYKNGYVNGYEDNTFRADNYITRAEFIKIVMQIVKEKAVEKDFENVFSDVKEEDWFYEAVSKASGMGIVNGSNGLFRPQANISREDAAVIIYRALSLYKSVSGNKVFPDRSEISNYARDAVASLGAVGIVKGDGEGFKPKDILTRAQSAQLIYNSLEFIK